MDIDISVSPIIKEWIVATHGTDTVQCSKNDFLSHKIKYLLQLNSGQFIRRNIDPINRITVKLINFSIGPAECRKTINVDYRYSLPVEYEQIIEAEFYQQFKQVFHSFVLGYCQSTNNSLGSQKEGIESFCETYSISLNKINYEMLKKSWDRSLEKTLINRKIKRVINQLVA